MEIPETRYAKTADGAYIAYQIMGTGPIDLVGCPGGWTHLDMRWEGPGFADYMLRVGTFARYICFDKRGMGLSDRPGVLPTFEQQADDILAVMDAAGSAQAALFGSGDGAILASYFAASHPERTASMIWYSPGASLASRPLLPEFMSMVSSASANWGSADNLAIIAPSRASDPVFREWWSRFSRAAASPGSLEAWKLAQRVGDARTLLQSLHLPMLILHRADERFNPIDVSRSLVAQLEDAKLVELSGEDYLPFVGDFESIVGEMEEFLTGVRPERVVDRVLATVMFVDVVSSTEAVATLGDRLWRETLDRFRSLVRRELSRARGREINTRGDDFLATFDGPARAVACAKALRRGASDLGLRVRSGLHTGEVELQGRDISGIAVHIGARISDLAAADDIVVSHTVKDLVAGSGLRFKDIGAHSLKGVPDDWHLFLVED